MIVESDVFAVRIESQSRPDTAVDWRRNQFDVPYSVCDDLPRLLLGRLAKFHRRAGLCYGAYDFIVTPGGDFVFLEVNPAGQWLWLESATRVPVAAAMAKLLTAGRQR